MRQGGYKPKNHNSVVYWVRANANTGGKRKTQEEDVIKYRWYHYVIGLGLVLWVWLLV